MTEELSPEFLQFSELLDQEDALSTNVEHTEEASILLELRQVLREETKVSPLPSDFASLTARSIVDKFGNGSPFSGWRLSLWRILFSRVGGVRLVLAALGAAGLIGLFTVWQPKILLILAVLVLSGSLFGGFTLDWESRGSVWDWAEWRASLLDRANLVLPTLALLAAAVALGGQAAHLAFPIGADGGLPAAAGLIALPVALWGGRRLSGLTRHSKHRIIPIALTQTVSACSLWICLWSVGWVFDAKLLAAGLAIGLMVAAFLPLGGDSAPTSVRTLKRLFYALPVIDAVLSAILAGSFIMAVGTLSFSFQNQPKLLASIALGVSLSLLFLIVNAARPYWEAQLAQAERSSWRAFLFQMFHLAWGVGLVYLLISLAHEREGAGLTNLAAPTGLFTLLAFLSWGLAATRNFEIHSALTLGQARRRAAQSLLLGFIPLLATGYLFYQVSLTREIYDPTYLQIQQDVKSWRREQKAIPDEQNGWLVIRPYFLKPELANPVNSEVNRELKLLSEYVQESPDDYKAILKSGRQEEFERLKASFLKHLPLLKQTLNKPQFSTVAVEGHTAASYVPDLIACRAISQAFHLLYLEQLHRNNSQQALDYAKLGLAWGSRLETSSLIFLMFRTAQLRISVGSMEHHIVSGRFNGTQLKELSKALQQARPQAREFSDTMQRETVWVDGMFDLILSGENSLGSFAEDVPDWYVKVMPKSYWQSERKAFWNNQLALCYTWWNLALPENRDQGKNAFFNFTSELLVANSQRAQTQFCYLHSHLSALILCCELERYRLDRGTYPATLDQLVPAYLPELPEDFMKPSILGRKGGFDYQRTGNGYRLVSRSPAYERIQMETEQVYGPRDGDTNE